MLSDFGQTRASSHIWGFQRPFVPERQLVADDGALVGQLIRDWSGPRLQEDLTDEDIAVYRRAMCIPSTAHCSIEPYRWMMRSMARPDGLQFNRRMKRPVRVPTLHLHGSLDPVMRTRSAVEAPASTSKPRTGGGCSTVSGTSRTRRTRWPSPPSW